METIDKPQIVFRAKELGRSGIYQCPLCKVQNTALEPDTGWILCPMINNQAICLGCCFDYQSIARSDDYEDHPFRDDLDSLAAKSNKHPNDLRKTCLSHQIEICLFELKQTKDAIEIMALKKRIAEIETLLAKIT
jgi:hypothetical protein